MFYAPIKLGPHSSKTPEGFRLYEAVPIARTGLQIYGPNEVPVDDAGYGFIKVDRFPEDVFRPETIQSAEGKPVVEDHPSDNVGPKNWRDLARGHIQNVRRGEGVDEDLLLGDMIVMDQSAIDAIDRGKKEVSLGYDADYEILGPAHARQHNIIVNHMALVDAARCGPRCRIRDHAVRVRTHDALNCGLMDDGCRDQIHRRHDDACSCDACQAQSHPTNSAGADDKDENEDHPPASVTSGKNRRRRHLHLHL